MLEVERHFRLTEGPTSGGRSWLLGSLLLSRRDFVRSYEQSKLTLTRHSIRLRVGLCRR